MPISENARRLADLFVGNDSWHGVHGAPEWDEAKSKWGIRSTAKTLPGNANVDLWQQHLDGTQPLGVVPVRLEKIKGKEGRTLCRWGCGDVDDYNADVVALVQKVEKIGYPLVPCRSKSGGLHLFLFLREWEDPVVVQVLVRDMMASLGHAEAEVFPKQSRLVDGRDKGSWIVMPYFGGDYEGKLTMQRGVKASGSDMTAEEFVAAATAALTSTAEIKVQRVPAPRRPGNGAAPPRGPQAAFGDGPPCLEYLAENGVGSGGQNNALLMMGVYYKKADPQNWRARLERANAEFLRPPGSAEGLMAVIRSLEKKEYFYTCRSEPMRSFCNSRLCRGRPHGVGEVSEVPRITHILQRMGDEKKLKWIVQLQGVEHRFELTSQEFQEYRKFRLRAFDRTGGINFSMMKEADWSLILTAAMNTVMDVDDMKDVPDDLKPGAKFREVFNVYTGNRAVAKSMDELGGTYGKPWQDTEGEWGRAGWWYLRLKGFEHMVQEHDKSIRWSRDYLVELFEGIGGVNVKQNIGGRPLSLWGFPPEAVQREPPRVVREHREDKI